MKNELQKLMDRVSGLADEDLLRMIEDDSPNYRFEAIIYAKAEAGRRGLSYCQPDATAGQPMPSSGKLGRNLVRMFRSHMFIIGGLVGLMLLIRVNYSIYKSMLLFTCDDCALRYGFPFNLYQTGGFASAPTILWDGLIADAAIALSLGIAVGWLFKKILGVRKP